MKRLLVCLLLATLPMAAGAIGGWGAEWSPDGRRIAFTSAPPHGIPDIWVINSDGQDMRQLTALGGRSPKWIPGSDNIAFASLRTGTARQYVVDSTGLTGSDILLPGGPEDAQEVVWSRDGSRIAFGRLGGDSTSRDLWVASADGSNAKGITSKFWVREYAWRPDGKQIAAVIGRDIGSSLWAINPETKSLSLVYEGFCSAPTYSPDGRYMAYAIATKMGRQHNIVCLERATAKRIMIPVKAFDGKRICWRPDSKHMLFGSETKTDVTVWAAGLDPHDLVKVTPPEMQLFDASYSPDGKRIIFSGTAADSQGVDIYVCSATANIPFGAVKALSDKTSPEKLAQYEALTDSRANVFSPVWFSGRKISRSGSRGPWSGRAVRRGRPRGQAKNLRFRCLSADGCSLVTEWPVNCSRAGGIDKHHCSERKDTGDRFPDGWRYGHRGRSGRQFDGGWGQRRKGLRAGPEKPAHASHKCGADAGDQTVIGKMTVGRDDKLYITDPAGQRVLVYDKDGKLILTFGSSGRERGEFQSIEDVAVDRQGRIYVTDATGVPVQVFDKAGKFIYRFGSRGALEEDFVQPSGLAIDRFDQLWIVDTAAHKIRVFDRLGFFLTSFGSYGMGEGSFFYPACVGLDNLGRVYVLEKGMRRLQVFTLDRPFEPFDRATNQ